MKCKIKICVKFLIFEIKEKYSVNKNRTTKK